MSNRIIVYRCRNYITHVCPEVVWAAGHTCKKCIDAGYYPKDEGPYKGEWPPKRKEETEAKQEKDNRGEASAGAAKKSDVAGHGSTSGGQIRDAVD